MLRIFSESKILERPSPFMGVPDFLYGLHRYPLRKLGNRLRFPFRRIRKRNVNEKDETHTGQGHEKDEHG